MGKIKTSIKEAIIKKSVLKRKKNSSFNDIESEGFVLSDSAGREQNNSYYFSAHSEDYSLFLRLGIRGGGEHEVWFAYFNKDGTAFVNDGQSFEKDNCPITLKCLEPLKKWSVCFNGAVKRAERNGLILEPIGESLEASFEGYFDCHDKLYEFSRDADETAFAKAVARERWSKEFFKALKENSQVHTEQSGHLTGELIVEGKKIGIDCAAMRDHSFGKREWDYMNRHIWLTAVSNLQQLNISMVSYPALSELKVGYSLKDGIINNVVLASSMSDIAKCKVPDEFDFECTLKSGEVLKNKCIIEAIFPFVMGDGAYTIFEGIATFVLDDGKVMARGIAEFGYNADENRYKKI